MSEIEIPTDKVAPPRSAMVHFVLSHSYIVFLLAVLLGLIFHIIFNTRIFPAGAYPYKGAGLIVLGSLIIYWAKHSSTATRKEMKVDSLARDFARGPYKYSRNPTHIGLTLLLLGLGVMLNSFFMVVFLIIASLISKLYFLRVEEALLEKRYGQEYSDYKKKVNSWV